MSVGFLSDNQRRRYGRFHGEPTQEDLACYFHLDDNDRNLIELRRGDHNRLGYAVQLCTVRYLGTFREDLTETPSTVVAVLARQLSLKQEQFADYCAGRYRWDHAREIRKHYGYCEFSDPSSQFRLNRWLYALCWTGTERPGMLFDRATTWLIVHRVLLPGVTVLERHVARIRARVQERLWLSLIRDVSPATKQKLDALLAVPDNGHQSFLDRLRKGPFRRSAPELVRALKRLEDVRSLGIDIGVSHRIPPGRIQALARFAATAKASAIERQPETRRLATLVAFTLTLEATVLDDALDLLDILITDIFSNATKAGEKARLRTIRDFDTAAAQLGQACQVILDPAIGDTGLRMAIFKTISREDLETALRQVDTLARPSDNAYYQELTQSWSRVQRFLPHVLRAIHFGSTPAGDAIAQALRDLVEQDGPRMKTGEVHREVVTRGWRRSVFNQDGAIDRKAYVFCCLDCLRSALRRRDLFVAPSIRYADARIGLLSGAAWDAARSTISRSLGHSLSAEETIAALAQELDQAYRTVTANLPGNPAARVETSDGKDDLVLTGLDKLEDPASLVRLREAVNARLPRVELPEILLEIATRTDFTSKFTHVSERESRVGDLPVSLCAVLIAEACNIGLEPLVRNDIPALRRSRLSWVNQNFIRSETLTEANACLVAAQNSIPLVQTWGGGEVASADGLRFVVPVRTLHAGPNPKYFGYERGVTYYNLVSNQFTGLNAVVPGTLRDSLFLLAIVLEQQTELDPTEIMTDTGAYTDVVFGLFWLLGYRFSPRIADIGDSRYWRVDPSADYGCLNGVARHRVNTGLIKDNWDDLLRLAGSLSLGVVQATSIMRTLRVGERPTRLAQAVGELGRIDKTIHSLTYIDDESKRRRTLTQLNRQEDRHKLARAVFHGKRGELRQRYREGQEDQLGTLGLVVNIIVLWNTLYIDAALEQLQAEGFPVQPEDVARLSPLVFEHINLLGRYAFSVPEAVLRGELRPLR
ncbi:MAG: Tn3 family transposase, partial [Syntrophobacteraceae bacterium]